MKVKVIFYYLTLGKAMMKVNMILGSCTTIQLHDFGKNYDVCKDDSVLMHNISTQLLDNHIKMP